jgi:hypothetical protein
MKNVILFLFIVLSSIAKGQQYPISNECRVSLLTCTPGDELYSCFGHSAIRIQDKKYDVDLVFNYGTFDFNKPNFYVNFLKGILIYSLGVDDFESFKSNYIYEERGIAEQVLRLDSMQKLRLVNFLMHNATPENRDYRYDFLLDNCATRIIDALDTATHGQITYHTANWDTTITFRNLIDEYSYDKRWENFGMNLLIGYPVDKPTSPREQQFLPDYLAKAIASATISADGKNIPLVLSKKTLLSRPQVPKVFSFFTPEYVFVTLLLLSLVLTIIDFKTKIRFRLFDAMLFFSVGILGLIMFNLWFFTQHWTTAINLNILWAMPTHLLLAILVWKKTNTTWLRWLVIYSLISTVGFLLFHTILPQHFQIGMVYISTSVSLRLGMWYYRLSSYYKP